MQAPTGTGKTGIILAWLWRRLYAEPDSTPRRLVYALPQRSLVEQVAGEAGRWLANLGLADRVALHVVMGGRSESQRQWRQDMHMPAIVVGTVDSLVSKALNRGYGIGRGIYPIDFALVTNGAHWVIDEIQLCPESTTTLRQLAAFARKWPTAEPFGLTCMSATIPRGLLETVDNPAFGDMVEIRPEERAGELKVRLDAERTVRRLGIAPGDYKALASAARERHRPGELTLVVLNTVEAARQTFRHLNKDAPAECTLLHSRFRAVEREQLMKQVTEHPQDRIVVSTQVVEAGIDLNAAVLITEGAPWPSLVQRAGRCNRTGRVENAELWWIAPPKPDPYEQPDIDATGAALAGLDGKSVTGENLLGHDVFVTREQVAVLRRSDFAGLFDTAPDLSGNDIDIAPYVRDADDLDAQLAWAAWTAGTDDGAPPEDAKSPSAEYRCRVPVPKVNEFARSKTVWRLDQVLGKWTRVNLQSRARPGEVLVVNAADGGYDPVTGFDPAAPGPVPGCLALGARAEPADGTEDRYAADSASVRQRKWISLDQHSQETRDQARELLDVLRPTLPDDAARSAVTAAYLHDAGKAHEIWQDALCDLAQPNEKDRINAGRPWAKSNSDRSLLFKGGVAFRHELASLLILDGPLNDLLKDAPDPDLARYLVLAHHGKLRIQVRNPSDLAVLEAADDRTILGLRDGHTTDIRPLLGRPATRLTVDLDQFTLGGDRSWTRTALNLRDRYGPFVLAYLEAVVRIADWRASGEAELARAEPEESR
ncbi:MAG TPA: CRISPR-associated helicase Cas3' [Streptosporangiaceae bacterium]|nr:CRISPR-associated helicase Cas3' [Streptosporangiaceae bacterium]